MMQFKSIVSTTLCIFFALQTELKTIKNIPNAEIQWYQHKSQSLFETSLLAQFDREATVICCLLFKGKIHPKTLKHFLTAKVDAPTFSLPIRCLMFSDQSTWCLIVLFTATIFSQIFYIHTIELIQINHRRGRDAFFSTSNRSFNRPEHTQEFSNKQSPKHINLKKDQQ